MNGKNMSEEWRVNHDRWAVQSRKPPFILHHSSFILSPRGFTLVELLVTITIIGIIAGMSLGALQWARRYAAEEKTKATIAKLDAIITQRYESYFTRRMPINIPAGTLPKNAALMKLNALRDLMRMEMPDRWEDVDLAPISDIPKSPALHLAYKNKKSAAKTYLVGTKSMNISDADALIGSNGGAECLYQIVALGSSADMEQFSQNEIADTDSDTLPEFIDGWGKPISFLRWAAGFNSSNIQPNINTNWNDVTAKAQRLAATQEDHDPFDSRKVDVATKDDGNVITPPLPTGWRLVPLIYSGGSDTAYGICDVKQFKYRGNPYETIKDQKDNFRGMGAPTGTSEDFDNITNHQIEMK